MVVYASATNLSVKRMFLAGVIPGLLAGVMLVVTIYVIAVKRNLTKGDFAGWGEVCASSSVAFWGLLPCSSTPGGDAIGGSRGVTGSNGSDEQIPQSAARAILGFGSGPTTFLRAVDLILLIGGSWSPRAYRSSSHR